MNLLCRCSRFLPLVIFLAIGGTAYADTFHFTIDGPYSAAGSGYLNTVADPGNPNALDIISISGKYDGQTILGLLPCTTYDATSPCSIAGASFGYDNLLYPNGGFAPGWIVQLDEWGIGFELQDGSLIDVAADGSHTYDISIGIKPGGSPTLSAGFDAVLTPEPDSFLMLATGLLGGAVALRRRIAG